MSQKKIHLAIANVDGTEDGWSLVLWNHSFRCWMVVTNPDSFHRTLKIMLSLDMGEINK